jgi:PAS domain S-box-containing protein
MTLLNDHLNTNEALSARLTNIINNLPAGVCILNGPEFILEEVNSGMLQIWDRDRSIIGKKLLEFMPELADQAFPTILTQVYSEGIPHIEKDALVQINTLNGNKMVYMDYSYTPLKNSQGVVDAILVHANEVSERTRSRLREQQLFEELSVINEELTASNEELEATNDILSNSQKVLKESEETIRFMFNAIPQQVWMASADGKLTYANHVMCNDLGVSMETILQQGWRQYLHPDDLLKALEKWNNARQNVTPYTVDFRLRFKDNQYVWHLMSVVPMLEDGEVKFWIGTNTNIKLQKANEEKKDEFLSIASHELKTPLTNIKAFNQLISRTEDKNKIKEFTKRSSDHIGKLEWLINDLLDVTKINAGKMVYNMQRFDFRSLIINSINSIQQTTDTHQIELIGEEEITYEGDQFRLEQVMQNFLSNAVKYSPNANKVIVRYQLDQQNILVSVQDFGIGIEQKNFNQLFDRYYRVDNTSMRFEGIGLGLYISSEILKRHQGSFWIESEEGFGSTFSFRLPLDRSNAGGHEVNLQEYYNNKQVTIAYNEAHKRLDVAWKGYQDIETVQHGCLKMLEMLSRHKISDVINDNRDVLGTWSDASDWVGQVWFPLMEKAGLECFAWIYSTAAFSKLSAKKAAEIGIGNVDIKFFTTLDRAEEWLESKG